MITIQIGANRGNDHFTDITKNKDITTLILVEPFSCHNNSLEECYKHIKNKYIENIIITDDNLAETKTIYYHEQDGLEYGNALELASLNKQHCFNIRGYYEESGLKELQRPNITINNLFNKYNLKTIDILAIDTEGYDSNIIQSIDFQKFTIKEIYYENIHVDAQQLRSFLREKNYTITERVFEGWSDCAVLQA